MELPTFCFSCDSIFSQLRLADHSGDCLPGCGYFSFFDTCSSLKFFVTYKVWSAGEVNWRNVLFVLRFYGPVIQLGSG